MAFLSFFIRPTTKRNQIYPLDMAAMGKAARKDQEALGVRWFQRRGLLGLLDKIRDLFQ